MPKARPIKTKMSYSNGLTLGGWFDGKNTYLWFGGRNGECLGYLAKGDLRKLAQAIVKEFDKK